MNPEELALCDILRDACYKANALDGKHARQWDGSYGAISKALIKTLATMLEGLGYGPRKALWTAETINEVAIDSGVSITEAYTYLCEQDRI